MRSRPLKVKLATRHQIKSSIRIAPSNRLSKTLLINCESRTFKEIWNVQLKLFNTNKLKGFFSFQSNYSANLWHKFFFLTRLSHNNNLWQIFTFFLSKSVLTIQHWGGGTNWSLKSCYLLIFAPSLAWNNPSISGLIVRDLKTNLKNI